MGANPIRIKSGGLINLHAFQSSIDMEISPQHRYITLQVLQQISENPELINSDERFKSLIARIYKQSRKANKNKNIGKVETKEKQCCYICQQYFTRSHDFYH